MKKIVCGTGVILVILSLLGSMVCYAEEGKNEIGTLYAQSAVLMDGNSGRVLYEKNGEEFLANASTTKILTCILALEKGKPDDVVSVSSYAASMPDVQLNIREGERYLLKDLLYSLMLESHNDVAVAIAEHIAGSCEAFSDMMNLKAKEIGCENTYFLTPNGLDANENIILKNGEEKAKYHGTTAKDLARIMRYCIRVSAKKEEFLEITGTPSHSFGDIDGKRSFFCRNHNSFLNMMEGAISGKTGFTGKAGYCYVGALEREGKSYIVALLACGWPGNKTYKWKDCRKLMEYGLENYELFDMEQLEPELREYMQIQVENGISEELGKPAVASLKKENTEIIEVLLKEQEKVTAKVLLNKMIAPVEKNAVAGKIVYYINGEKWQEENVFCEKEVQKINFVWCMETIQERFFLCGRHKSG